MTLERALRWRVFAALILVQLFFGLQYLLAKFALQELPPRAFALLRIAGGAGLLLLVARAGGRRLPREPRVLGQLALLAILGVIVNQVMFAEGLSRTTPTHSSLINTTIPFLTLGLAVLLRREPWRPLKLLALTVGFVGVALVIRPEGAGLVQATVAGDLLTLCNAASFSLFLVLSRPLLARQDPLGATAVLMSFGALGIGIVGAGPLLATDLGQVSGATWAIIGYVVVFPTALAYLFQYWALRHVPSSEVALFIYLQPVIAATLSMAVLAERPGWRVWLGGGLIFAGVYLTLAAGRRAARQKPPPAPGHDATVPGVEG